MTKKDKSTSYFDNPCLMKNGWGRYTVDILVKSGQGVAMGLFSIPYGKFGKVGIWVVKVLIKILGGTSMCQSIPSRDIDNKEIPW